MKKIVEEHPAEIEMIFRNFHNVAEVRTIAQRIGLTEEDSLRFGGGLGCGALVVLIIVVVVVCIWIVFC